MQACQLFAELLCNINAHGPEPERFQNLAVAVYIINMVTQQFFNHETQLKGGGETNLSLLIEE